MKRFNINHGLGRSWHQQIKPIHTLKEILLSHANPKHALSKHTALSLSLNIHDRKDPMSMLEYSQRCIEADLHRFIKPFQAPNRQITLCMVIAESTIFIKQPQSEKFRARGGHILAIEVVAPPAGETTIPIITNIISKLPGRSPTRKSDAELQDGRALIGGDYEVPAHYEEATNAIFFRDTNSPINSHTEIVAPTFIGVLDPHQVGFDFARMIENARKIEQKDKTYGRMGGACGEFIIECYDDQLLGNRSGMSTQKAFDLFFTSIIEQTKNNELINQYYNARNELKFNRNPIDMLTVGQDSKKQYLQICNEKSTLDSNIVDPSSNLPGGKAP